MFNYVCMICIFCLFERNKNKFKKKKKKKGGEQIERKKLTPTTKGPRDAIYLLIATLSSSNLIFKMTG